MRQFDCLSYFHLAAEDRPRHDGALPLDLEAVIDRELEVLVLVLPVWYIDMYQYSLDQVLYTVGFRRLSFRLTLLTLCWLPCLHSCGHWHYR